MAQLDNESFSSEEEQETVDRDEVFKESDADDTTNTSEEEDSTEEQKNKDESSVMVGNGSFSPSDHEVSDKDSEEVNEPVTQIEMETRWYRSGILMVIILLSRSLGMYIYVGQSQIKG